MTGRLRVNIDPWFARMVLAPRLAQFMDLHPSLSVELVVSNWREDMMLGADVAVRFGPPDIASLITRKLLETRVLTCAAPAYLERHGEPRVTARPRRARVRCCSAIRRPAARSRGSFIANGEVVAVTVAGRLVTDDPSVAVAACVAGQGLFQSLELGLEPWLASGQLVQILPDWAEERFPLYAYHPSRHLPPAKVRAFLDFVQNIARAEALRTPT